MSISEETRKKMSEVQKDWMEANPGALEERLHSPTAREKRSETLRKRKVSEETRKKMSESQKKRYERDPELREWLRKGREENNAERAAEAKARRET